MAQQDLLIEIGCEEIPAKLLKNIITQFQLEVEKRLTEKALCFGPVYAYATPRRLALVIETLADRQPDRFVERKGPSLQAAFDASGNPTKAALGFAQSCQVSFDQLERLETDQGTWLIHKQNQIGMQSQDLLPALIEEALFSIHLPRSMRWSDKNIKFIRPIQWICCVYGDKPLQGTIAQLPIQATTRGHRVHAPEPICIDQAKNYEKILETRGFVLADMQKRRDFIAQELHQSAKAHLAQVLLSEDLLDEVTNLVEWPVVKWLSFDKSFLNVPKEALIAAMEDHQKSFAVMHENGEFLPNFLTVTNISGDFPGIGIGNERVMRARLSDAKFFYEADLKQGLNITQLENMVFQQGLGSVYDKVERLEKLIDKIKDSTVFSEKLLQNTKMAAKHCKTDLCSQMVNEFSELQGVMGGYYIAPLLRGKSIKEDDIQHIASIIQTHYQPKKSEAGALLALMDKLDTLVGYFAIGKEPTGDKDPFGLRRAANSVLLILFHEQWDLDLDQYVEMVYANYQDTTLKTPIALNIETKQKLLDFISMRFRNIDLPNGGISSFVRPSSDEKEAVLAVQSSRPVDAWHRLVALHLLLKQEPEKMTVLIASNKRVRNILQKQTVLNTIALNEVDLQEKAEKNLWDELKKIERNMTEHLQSDASEKYKEALKDLLQFENPLNHFFNEVMVMVDDETLRNNRLQLLQQVRALFLQVADLSLLS